MSWDPCCRWIFVFGSNQSRLKFVMTSVGCIWMRFLRIDHCGSKTDSEISFSFLIYDALHHTTLWVPCMTFHNPQCWIFFLYQQNVADSKVCSWLKQCTQCWAWVIFQYFFSWRQPENQLKKYVLKYCSSKNYAKP